MIIRKAKEKDIPRILEVIRASVTNSCRYKA